MMIEIEKLTKRYGPILAVDAVTFSVDKGEVLGFLGPNGAGKSTTLRMITGFTPPTSGSARVQGVEVSANPIEAKKRIGYMPEGAPAYPDMTPAAFLDFIAAVRGFDGAERRRRVSRAVELAHLDEVLYEPIDNLSKGFKRRVGLAQALLHDPEVLLLDEPTDGLDPNQKHEVRALITAMAKDKVIVISTHILEEVDAVCTRAVIIARGRLIADSTPEALLARSRHHNALTLQLENRQTAAIKRALGKLDSVAAVEEGESRGGRASLVVYPRRGADLRAEIEALAREQGWALAGLTIGRGHLDDVFRELTTAAAA